MVSAADCKAFTDALRATLEGEAARGGEAAGDCRAILAALPAVLPPPKPGPARTVAVNHLDGALGRANGTPMEGLARAFAPVIRGSGWLSTEGYRAQGMDQRFFDNYGYVKYMGPGTNAPDRGISAGCTMLGPHIHYPAHAHPARELYLVLSGTAEWQRGEEAWAARPPGSFVVHPSMAVHAMRTAGEALLALYFWTGDLTTESRLVPGR